MTDANHIPTLYGPMIQDVVLVDRIERPHPISFNNQCPPGHMIHFHLSGEVGQKINGIEQHFQAGQATWYHENETIAGSILKAPWIFYTVNFTSPRLFPPRFADRVIPISDQTISQVEELFSLWQDQEMSSILRHLQLHATLLQLLVALLPPEAADEYACRFDPATEIWWWIENQLKGNLSMPIDLRYLEKMSNRSRRTINRACIAATGKSPMKRIKYIRMVHARDLVTMSEISMTEIAFRLGYSRVQEFSRDYGHCFSVTPRDDRKLGPDYRDE